MNIIKIINKVSEKPKAITIGNFDGVHKGHQSLLKKTKEIAEANNLESLVLTFNKSPKEIFNPSNFQRLYNNDNKCDFISSYKIDVLLSIDFNMIKNFSADFFCNEVLINQLHIKYLIIGDNFKFGKDRKGNIETLKEYHRNDNFKLIIPKLEIYKDMHISSSRIRKLLTNGDFSDAKECLGKDFMISGNVISGEKLGRKLGFPTANIALKYNYPLDGIYLTKIKIGSAYYHGLTSIGNKPTFNGKEKLLEVFILDFNKDIYGKNIKVFFLEKIRDQIKFENKDDLIKQMNEDHKYAIINSKKYGI